MMQFLQLSCKHKTMWKELGKITCKVDGATPMYIYIFVYYGPLNIATFWELLAIHFHLSLTSKSPPHKLEFQQFPLHHGDTTSSFQSDKTGGNWSPQTSFLLYYYISGHFVHYPSILQHPKLNQLNVLALFLWGQLD